MPPFPARLHVLLAREAPVGLIIRRGPSHSVASVLWNRRTDRFTLGQWLRGRIYERRCDLSPDGTHVIYFAMNGRWQSDVKGSYTAIARAPASTKSPARDAIPVPPIPTRCTCCRGIRPSASEDLVEELLLGVLLELLAQALVERALPDGPVPLHRGGAPDVVDQQVQGALLGLDARGERAHLLGHQVVDARGDAAPARRVEAAYVRMTTLARPGTDQTEIERRVDCPVAAEPGS